MRVLRAHFKLALRKCKADKTRAVADSLAKKFLMKDSKDFWREIHNITSSKQSCAAQTIGGSTGPEAITDMW